MGLPTGLLLDANICSCRQVQPKGTDGQYSGCVGTGFPSVTGCTHMQVTQGVEVLDANVEGRGLERVYERERNQLHTVRIPLHN
jgi:hypothetical protein